MYQLSAPKKQPKNERTLHGQFLQTPAIRTVSSGSHVASWLRALGELPLQTRLTVNEPGDVYEEEADRVATEVVRIPNPTASNVRRCACGEIVDQTGECSACRARRLGLQRKSDEAGGMQAPQSVQDVIGTPGEPLDAETRRFMKVRFGRDFGNVRVHTGGKAAESAKTMSARAYTIGSHIVFGNGQYIPNTASGRWLLAHELTHVLQQAKGVHRDIDTGSLGESGGNNVSLDRIRSYVPNLRSRAAQPPVILMPPTPQQTGTMSAICPSPAEVIRDLRSSGIGSRIEREMQRQVNIAHLLGQQAIPFSPRILVQADQAIRAEFGHLLSPSRNLALSHSLTASPPQAFAILRIPDDNSARSRIGEIALEKDAELLDGILRSLCIDTPTHPLLQSIVIGPLYSRLGLNFVRDYEEARVGGQTNYPVVGGQVQPHITIPSASRNMGHIVAHEGLHFYVSGIYQRTAESGPIQQQMMEGGAEFLTRHVINRRLSTNPHFRINFQTYSNEFAYVAAHLLGGGIAAFSQAYFRGRVDLLGLAPPRAYRVVQPKLIVSHTNDASEVEADRVADLVTKNVPNESIAPPTSRAVRPPILQRQSELPDVSAGRQTVRADLRQYIRELHFAKVLDDCPAETGVRLLDVLMQVRGRIDANAACMDFFRTRLGADPLMGLSPYRGPSFTYNPSMRQSGHTERASRPLLGHPQQADVIQLGNGMCVSPQLHRVIMHELAHQTGCRTGRPEAWIEAVAEQAADVCVGTRQEQIAIGNRTATIIPTTGPEDWSFTPIEMYALQHRRATLRFAADSEWFPVALRENLRNTLLYLLALRRDQARTEGVNPRDFFHGHVVIPHGSHADALLARRDAWSHDLVQTRDRELGPNRQLTLSNLPAYSAQVSRLAATSTVLLDQASRMPGAAVIYHTFEFPAANSPGSQIRRGAPQRNFRTPLSTNVPAPYTAPNIDDANSYQTEYNHRIEYTHIYQFSFLVDRTGVIHVRPDFRLELSTVTGMPLSQRPQ